MISPLRPPSHTPFSHCDLRRLPPSLYLPTLPPRFSPSGLRPTLFAPVSLSARLPAPVSLLARHPTPRFPPSGEEGIDLPRWVQSMVCEKWTVEVFDVELMRYQNIKEEMVQLLQIAMTCVSTIPDQRPAIQEVVRMIKDMNRVETDDGQRHSLDDQSKSGGQTPPTKSRTPSAIAMP